MKIFLVFLWAFFSLFSCKSSEKNKSALSGLDLPGNTDIFITGELKVKDSIGKYSLRIYRQNGKIESSKWNLITVEAGSLGMKDDSDIKLGYNNGLLLSSDQNISIRLDSNESKPEAINYYGYDAIFDINKDQSKIKTAKDYSKISGEFVSYMGDRAKFTFTLIRDKDDKIIGAEGELNSVVAVDADRFPQHLSFKLKDLKTMCRDCLVLTNDDFYFQFTTFEGLFLQNATFKRKNYKLENVVEE